MLAFVEAGNRGQSDEEERERVEVFLTHTSLRQVFEALAAAQTVEEEQIGSKALDRIFSCSASFKLIADTNNIPYLQGGLAHSSDLIRLFTLKQLTKVFLAPPVSEKLPFVLSHLLQSIWERMGDSNIEIMQEAENFLVGLAVGDGSEQVLALIMQARTHWLLDSTVHMRVLNLISRVAFHSSQSFLACQSSGALDLLLSTMNSKDVLVRVNTIELVDRLCNSPHAVPHLLSTGMIKDLLELAGGAQVHGEVTNPDPFLGGAALRAVSNAFLIASNTPEIRRTLDSAVCKQLLQAASALMSSTKGHQRITSMNALAACVSNSLVMMQELLEPPSRPLIEGWMRGSSSSDNEFCAACLHSVAAAITPHQGETAEEGTWSSTRQILFARLAPSNTAEDALKIVIGKIRLPFEKVRYACYDILRRLVDQPDGWGLLLMISHPGCMEMLLNRKHEDSKEGREWKFAIIECFHTSRRPELIGGELMQAIEKAHNKGPFR